MDRIQLQASKLWDLLFSDETAETYQTALNLTGTILKESAQLIWLIICSVFVFGAWFGDASVKTGNSLRTWIDEQGSPSVAAAGDTTSVADKGKSLLDSGRQGAAYLLAQAREQLGLEALPATPAKKKTKSTGSQPPGSNASDSKASDLKPAASESVVASKPVDETKTPSARSEAVVASEPVSAAKAAGAEDAVSRETTDDGWPPQSDDD
ncbi:MAG: hypothetical protein AAFR18_10535 [Cyanobacteria bacterium J06627_32]